MRYLLDGLPLTRTKTGIGHYTFELATWLARIASAEEFQFVSPLPYLRESVTPEDSNIPPNLRFEKVPASIVERRWFSVGLPKYLKRNNVDLFHGTNFEIPLRRSCACVVTVHDLSLLLYPETHLRHRVFRNRIKLPLMLRHATMVITPTEQVRREVCEHLGLNGDRVVSVAEAPRSIFSPASSDETDQVKQQFGIQRSFVLAVGTIEPRKNLISLVRAFALLKRKDRVATQLVITGTKGWRHGAFFDEIVRLGIGDSILFTDYVSDGELRALYTACDAFVYPSLYEGFGLPPLEALTCGAPVIVNRLDCLREVLGEAALFANAEDVSALYETIRHVLSSNELRSTLKASGLKRARLFTWERAASETMEVYKEAIARFKTEGAKKGNW
jgi:glycosyltransferase involved in cell wall biosynthesis